MNKIVKGKPSFPSGKTEKAQHWSESLCQIFFTLVSFVWFLAVVKVFLLGSRGEFHRHDKPQVTGHLPIPSINIGSGLAQSVELYTSPLHNNDNTPPVLTEKAKNIMVPSPNEWELIRADPNYHNPIVGLKTHPKPGSNQIAGGGTSSLSAAAQALLNKDKKPATELQWPPIREDGVIPDDEGSDTMPLTSLKVLHLNSCLN